MGTHHQAKAISYGMKILGEWSCHAVYGLTKSVTDTVDVDSGAPHARDPGARTHCRCRRVSREEAGYIFIRAETKSAAVCGDRGGGHHWRRNFPRSPRANAGLRAVHWTERGAQQFGPSFSTSCLLEFLVLRRLGRIAGASSRAAAGFEHRLREDVWGLIFRWAKVARGT